MSDPLSRRPKHALKRRLAVLSDAEDDDHDQSHSNAAISFPTGTSSLRGRSHTVDGDSDVEVEHDTLAESGTYLLQPAVSSSSSTSRLKKHKARPTDDVPQPAKKKRVKADVHSDEDYHMGAAFGADDDDLIIKSKRQPKLTAKAKARGAKAKRPTDGDALTMDGRTAHHGKLQPHSTEPSLVSGTKRQGVGSKGEDSTIDVGEMDASLGARSPSQPKEPSPPLKKRKFPTIKKNKGATTTSGSSLATKAASTAAITKPTAPKLPDLVLPPPSGTRKTPASIGNADFDLRNQSVYNELFKSAGGNTPRSGLSRREKDEERRKELNKMRDEARAKRLAETVSSFDLQAQSDKIIRFEERLRMDHSSALYPNFLAAKWRELWEREKHKATKEQEWSEGRNGDEAGEREEGEMN